MSQNVAVQVLGDDGVLDFHRIVHNMTACFLWRSKLPIAFPNDRDCIASGVATCWQPKPEALRLAIIANTLEVAELWVSPPLLEEARGRKDLEVLGPPRPLPFDAGHNLRQQTLFPHSVRGRRGHA